MWSGGTPVFLNWKVIGAFEAAFDITGKIDDKKARALVPDTLCSRKIYHIIRGCTDLYTIVDSEGLSALILTAAAELTLTGT